MDSKERSANISASELHWGFRYYDLLLTEAERGAWHSLFNNKSEIGNPALVESCRAVEQRAVQTLKWAEMGGQGSLLDIALGHLTFGRAALYRAILEKAKSEKPKSETEQAVSDLRRAGAIEFVASGLLTRAWLRSLAGKPTGPESAQSDLNEAWEIAERGPMPLFQTDILLHRARLFFREATYPWQSPRADLAEARWLIEKHGYLRRMEELEDAEKVIL